MMITVDPVKSEIAEIRHKPFTNHRSLYSLKDFHVNDVISPFGARDGVMYKAPTRMTLQLNETDHFLIFPDCLECINHSCEPNCFFDTNTMNLVAIREIKKGEELAFFYPSNEWDMATPFKCECGHPSCLGMISGAKHLPEEVLPKYRFVDFIQARLDIRHKTRKAS